VNVAGQALIPTIVAKREGILDEELYNAPREGLPFADDSDDDESDAAASDSTSPEPASTR
jgi:hypothetical protein